MFAPQARQFKRDCAPDAARGPGHQGHLTGEARSPASIAVAISNHVYHLITPILGTDADNCGINAHNDVTAHRAGAEAGREHPHRAIDSPLRHSVMDGQKNARGRGVADALDVEENPLARNSRGLRQREHHVLVGLVRNHQVDGVDQRSAGHRWDSAAAPARPSSASDSESPAPSPPARKP